VIQPKNNSQALTRLVTLLQKANFNPRFSKLLHPPGIHPQPQAHIQEKIHEHPGNQHTIGSTH
jgi:hypothetical protein